MTGANLQPTRKMQTRLIFRRLPFRVIAALRAGVVIGTLVGIGAGIGQLSANSYLSLGYWNTAATVMALELLSNLITVVVVCLLLSLTLTFYDTFTRDPDRSAFVLLSAGVVLAATAFAMDVFLRAGNSGSLAHLLRVVRAAIESAPPMRLLSRGILALAALHLLGHFLHALTRRYGRLPIFARWPRYYVTYRAARIVAWLAGGRPLTAAAVAVLVIGITGTVPMRRDAEPGPNVVLISVDTLRADHLGCYGYDRPTSPAIDRLAADATLFENAYSQAPWTLPSHASMLTSLRPSVHRADTYTSRLPARLLTLPEVLRERGYQTMAITSHVLLTDLYGIEQGFTRFHFNGEKPAREVTDKALAWIDTRSHKRPFFLFCHYFDVHADYDPPEPYRSQFADPTYLGETTGKRADFYQTATEPADFAYLESLYDGEIAYTDAHVGRLIDGLKERGLLDGALVVLVADHGEEFFEHGYFEHKTLHQQTLHVPMIVKAPGGEGAGRRVAALAQLVDLAPTVLSYTGLPAAAGGSSAMASQGRDLSPFVEVGDGEPTPEAFAEQHADVDPEGVFRFTVRDRDFRYIRTGRGAAELYDLRADPDELTDALGEKRPYADDLLGRLRMIEQDNGSLSTRLLGSHHTQREEIYLDPSTRQRLKVLGYVTDE